MVVSPKFTIVSGLLDRLDELTDRCVARISADIPGYAGLIADEDFTADVHEHVETHMTAVLEGFGSDRTIVREEFAFIGARARRRMGRVPPGDFMLAFHTAHVMLVDEVAPLAVDEASTAVVIALTQYLARYFGLAQIHASDAFIEARQLVAETGERQRRDLLEELLAGGYPSGPRLIVAVEAGLLPAARLVVVSARMTGADVAEESMRTAASALVRATRATLLPLAVVRRDEIVIVLPFREGRESDIVAWMAAAQRKLAERELVLSIGISTVRPDVSGVADAYREATDARERLADTGGVLGLPALSALDYVAAINQPGLQRLISERVRAFIVEDGERGGALLETLAAYTTTSLNVARTAELLGIHVNTAHYRISRIAERTGLDLRNVEDVMELVLAVRSHQPGGAGGRNTEATSSPSSRGPRRPAGSNHL